MVKQKWGEIFNSYPRMRIFVVSIVKLCAIC